MHVEGHGVILGVFGLEAVGMDPVGLAVHHQLNGPPPVDTLFLDTTGHETAAQNDRGEPGRGSQDREHRPGPRQEGTRGKPRAGKEDKDQWRAHETKIPVEPILQWHHRPCHDGRPSPRSENAPQYTILSTYKLGICR